MMVIMAVTLVRYRFIQDFRDRSSEHRFIVESKDIYSLERAIKGATYQDVESERLSDDTYRIVVKCPPEKIGYILGVMQKLGGKRREE